MYLPCPSSAFETSSKPLVTIGIDDAIRLVSSKNKENVKSASEGDKEEAKEADYDDDKDQLEVEQEKEAGETD